MQIIRIDGNRDVIDVSRIEIQLGDNKYTLTEYFGELKIHAHSDVLIVKPATANEVQITAQTND